MPRRRDNGSPSYDREETRDRNRKPRSYSPHESDKRSVKHGKHKTRDRSRSSSADGGQRRKRNKELDRRGERRHRVEQEEQFDPQRRIKQEREDTTNLSEQRRERRQNDERRKRSHQQRQAEGVDTNFGQSSQESQQPPEDKDKPDFKLSGKLTEDTNTFRGVVVNYNEPPEARKPKKKWRLYPFKGDTELPVLHVHRQSAYLFGRDRRVADIPVDHPSCSKQHAALQFRLVDFKREDGTRSRIVKPYVIDLKSANGTYVNNQKIDSERYVELFEKDVVKFGYSSREYVILHDKVDTSEFAEEESDD